MAITTSLLQDGTNDHKETVDKFNLLNTKLFNSDGIAPSGSIVNGTPDTGDFAVYASGTPDMNININTGSALVTGTPTSGTSQRVIVVNDAATTSAIAANSSGATKYDWVYIKLDPDAMKDPAVDASDVASIVTSRSTSSSTDDGTPPTYGLNIAVVTVANGASSITNANIADKRVFATSKVSVENNEPIVSKDSDGVEQTLISKNDSDQTIIGENEVRATRFVDITPVAVVNGANPSDATWASVDCTANTSANTYAVTGTAIVISTTANRTLHVRENGDSTAQGTVNQIANNPVASVAGVSAFTTGVDTGQIFQYSVNNGDVTAVYFIIRGYWEYVD